MVPANPPQFSVYTQQIVLQMGCPCITESINIQTPHFLCPLKREVPPTAAGFHLWSFLVRVPILRFIALLAEQADEQHFENHIFPAKLNFSPLGIQFTEKDGGKTPNQLFVSVPQET